MLLEQAVKAVDQPLVFHEDRAGEIVKGFGRAFDHILVERIEQDEMLLDPDRDAGGAQRVEEIEEHGPGL